MKAILADQNAEGHVAALVRILQREPWREFWADLICPYSLSQTWDYWAAWRTLSCGMPANSKALY